MGVKHNGNDRLSIDCHSYFAISSIFMIVVIVERLVGRKNKKSAKNRGRKFFNPLLKNSIFQIVYVYMSICLLHS